MQKTTYSNTKDAFLQHERWHIRTQKVAFRNVKVCFYNTICVI